MKLTGTALRWTTAAIALGAGIHVLSCGGSGDDDIDNNDNNNETPSSASDTESESDEDTSTLPETCLASISGRVLRNGEDPMEAVIVICIGTACYQGVNTESDGTFSFEPPTDDGEECVRYDFEEKRVHIELSARNNPERHASYAFVRRPTLEDISEQGEEDYDYDVGDLSLYEMPEESATYTPEDGVTVDLSGVAFTLEASSLVKADLTGDIPIDHEQQIRVFEAPLDDWNPPFADKPLDALYLVTPRWAKISGTAPELTVEPPQGWQDGDTGDLFLLGGYNSDWGDADMIDIGESIYRSEEENLCVTKCADCEDLTPVEDGELTKCGVAEMQGDRIITSPLPRLTWFGIGR
jgi:hypothetical protein